MKKENEFASTIPYCMNSTRAGSYQRQSSGIHCTTRKFLAFNSRKVFDSNMVTVVKVLLCTELVFMSGMWAGVRN